MASEGSHDSQIIINNRLLTGIQNVSFEQSVNENSLSVLGRNHATSAINGPTSVTASIDKVLLNSDYVTGLSGSSLISGQFIYGDNMLDFNSGVLNGYSVSSTIGETPKIAFDFTIYGDLKGTDTSRLSSATQDSGMAEVADTGITVTFDKQPTNSIQSCTYTENYVVKPTYSVGLVRPSDIAVMGPIVQEATIAIDVEDYEIEDNFSFTNDTTKNRDRDISLSIENITGGKNLFKLKNACLVSESISAGVGNTVVANLLYRGFKEFTTYTQSTTTIDLNVIINTSSFSSPVVNNITMSNFTTSRTYPFTQSRGASTSNGEILLDQGTNTLTIEIDIPGSETFSSSSLQVGSTTISPTSETSAGGAVTVVYQFNSDEGGEGPSDGETAVFTISFS